MKKEICIKCGRETVSVIKSDIGYICYGCHADIKTHSRKKKDNEEENIQCEFFKKVFIFFPKLPQKLLFAVPNGGSRNIIEAKNLKRQGVVSGVSDGILLIPKKGFASLCMEFKTKKGKQSKEQEEFQRQAELCHSKYVIVRSVAQAIEEMCKYLQ